MGTLLISKIREEYPDRMMLVRASLTSFLAAAPTSREPLRACSRHTPSSALERHDGGRPARIKQQQPGHSITSLYRLPPPGAHAWPLPVADLPGNAVPHGA